MKVMKLDLRVLIAALVAGIAAGLADMALYDALRDTMTRPLLIALMMGLFALILVLVITVVVMLCNSTQDEFWFLHSRPLLCVGMAVLLVLTFLSSWLFEWIYDHEKAEAYTGSSYIFVLDESQTMWDNDFGKLRYSSVNDVMSGADVDLPYTAYMFSDSTVQIRDMAPRSAGPLVRPTDADSFMGGTNIQGALETVYADLKSGKYETGADPHVVFLTDGRPGGNWYIENLDFMNGYITDGIKVSTIGFGDADEALLKDIASLTGGIYVDAGNAARLTQGFESITGIIAQRDLLSYRTPTEDSGMLAFERILFLTLIGLLITLMKAVACADSDSTVPVLIVGAVTSLLGALVLEFGLKAGLSETLCRMVYWIGLALTPHMTRASLGPEPGRSRRMLGHSANNDKKKSGFEDDASSSDF